MNASEDAKEMIAMPAYVTALVTVTNQQEILAYAQQVDATVGQYGGRFIVKGGPVAEVLEGDLRPHTVTILEFPTLERAQAWYRSPKYRDIIHYRHEAGDSQVILFQHS